MHPLVVRYDAERLARLSADRRRATLGILGALSATCDFNHIDPQAIRAVMDAWAAAGQQPSTITKNRAIMLAFAAWAWREGHVSGDTLLELRAIGPPNGSAARPAPQPYRPAELRELRRILDERWPRLADAEATRWTARWTDGRSPYSRIRVHAIRLQLDAVIALALHCGLRRDDIFGLDSESIHPDNAYIVVCDDGGPWSGKHRAVEYTDSAREAIVPWVRLRAAIDPDHERAWLRLWAAETVHEPMTRATFDRLLRTYVGEGWTLRRLRATGIVNRIRAGTQLEALRDQLGYSDIAELLPYARCVGGNPRREMQRCDGRFREITG